MLCIEHVHSMYSLYDSASTPDDIVRRAKELGCEHITLTDHGTLLGIDNFMVAGKKYGVNTIPGVEAYTENRHHLIIFAKDYQGFQSISYAVRDANLDIQHVGKRVIFPIMHMETLRKYFQGNDHVVATSACIQGAVPYAMLENFRRKRKYDKKIGEAETCRAGYEAWCNAAERMEEALQEEEDLKARIANQTKVVSEFKRERRKIESAYKKAEKRNDLEDQATARAQASRMDREIEVSESVLQSLKSDKEELKIRKREIQRQMTLAKREKEKYTKLLDEAAEFEEPVKEEELYAEAKAKLLELKAIFPNFYIELQNHGLDEEAYVMPLLVKLAHETGTPLIAANDAHMVTNSEDDLEARRIMRFNYFDKAQTLSDPDRELYLKSNEELAEALAKVVDKEAVMEAIKGTEILATCHVEFPKEKHYPKVPGKVSIESLVEKARARKIQAGEWSDEYETRLRHEMKVITDMGYVDYHLVVRDFCIAGRMLGKIPKEELKNMPDDFTEVGKWLKEKNFKSGVGVGPGRGSAAGSLVCYLLGITNIDPIKYNLLFERFLNPERVSMPDIDTDIKRSLRPTVIKYLKWKYGEKAVCSIMTETTYGARSAIQMAGRERADQLYGDHKDSVAKKRVYMEKVFRLSDVIPEKPDATLKDNMEALEKEAGNDPEMQLVLKHAKLIDGKVCGTGVHAGGVVISDNDNINDYVPLSWNEEKEVWAAQADMIRVEEKGLLKMDLLGLNTLDVISDCVQMVERYRGDIIDLDHIPFEDEVFREIYATGNTNSVFQFESEGMKSTLQEFKPTCFEDIILLNAAYRPGPMQYLPEVIKVKNGKAKAKYLTPELEDILSVTYGACIYQEQVMRIFQKLAGYTLGGSDIVRRYMSKKKADKLAIERKAFIYGDEARGIDGCIKRGISEDTANQIFDQMMEFAKYAFNKSHSAAYSQVSYITAWLKYHYPQEFLCAMFNNKPQDAFDPIVSDCMMMHIPLAPLDINRSYYNFTVENGMIRYGFSGVKGVGTKNEELFDEILKERKAGGLFRSYQDFLTRTMTKEPMSAKLFPKGILFPLVKAGAFDVFVPNREYACEMLGSCIFTATGEDAEKKSIAAIERMHFETKPADRDQNFVNEMELVGRIISEDPLKNYSDDETYGCVPFDKMPEGKPCNIMGFVTSVEEKVSQKGNKYVSMKLQGKAGSIECCLYNKAYEQYSGRAAESKGKVIKVNGSSAGGGRMFVNRLGYLNNTLNTYRIVIHSQEESEKAESLIEKVPQSMNRLLIVFCVVRSKNTGKYSPCEARMAKPIYVSDETIGALKREGFI